MCTEQKVTVGDTDLMQNVQSVKETSEQTHLGTHSQLVHFLENNELT